MTQTITAMREQSDSSENDEDRFHKTVSMSLVAEEMTQPHINFHSRILFCNKTPNDIIRLRYADADIVLAALDKRAPGKERISGVANDRLDTEIKMAACFLGKPAAFLESPEEQPAFSKKYRQKISQSPLRKQ